MSCERCKQNCIHIFCSICQVKSCPHSSIQEHLQLHPQYIHIICQQCQSDHVDKYCHNCQQHLCITCTQKIHNKAKRAKHILSAVNQQTLSIKQCYLFCADAIPQQNLLENITAHIHTNKSNHLILLEMDQIPPSNHIIIPFTTSSFNHQFINSILTHYPFITTIYGIESALSRKILPKINTTIEIKYLKIPSTSHDNSNDTFRINSSINQSSSTDNSMRKKCRKSPIEYFQAWMYPKSDRRRIIEEKYRHLADKGTLMLRRQHTKREEQSITRIFSRNIGEMDIEYASMHLDRISIECIYWVIKSIKVDRMTPSQKLILSRLKQSFDFKLTIKLWQQILKYIQSNNYAQDRMEKDPSSTIPEIMVGIQGEENILTLKNQQWSYEDQGVVADQSLEWKQFVELLNEYFSNHSQIGGGRYGCVQYAKLVSTPPLHDCSLGKLSLFVQEAINRVSNNDSRSFINNNSMEADVKLIQLYRDVKVMTIQLKLVEMFLDQPKGTPISLAQIPLNLKKKISFDFNIVELGFPKLKNLLTTISDKLILETTKSHVSYQAYPNTTQILEQQKAHHYQMSNILLSSIISLIDEICIYNHNIILQQLYNQLNTRLGFVFDYKLYNFPDFYQFVHYYCRDIINVQLISGLFVVYSLSSIEKYNHYQNPQNSTPKFNTSGQQPHKKVSSIKWEYYDDLMQEGVENENEFVEMDESQSYSDFRCIEKVLEDDSESRPVTVIQKQQEVIISSIEGRSDFDKEFGVNELELINEVDQNNNEDKIPRAHCRVKSITPPATKSNHNRVYSYFSKN